MEMSTNIALCPQCGWTGQESEFEVSGNERRCPSCEYVMKRD